MYDDSVFNDEPSPVIDRRDILAITLMERLSMPENIAQGLKYRTIGTGDLKSSGQVKRRIMEYVHINSLNGIPLRLGTLSRRFSRIAKKHGTSVAVIANQLMTSGHLIELIGDRASGLYSDAIYKERIRLVKEMDGDEHDPSFDIACTLLEHIDGRIPPLDLPEPKNATATVVVSEPPQPSMYDFMPPEMP